MRPTAEPWKIDEIPCLTMVCFAPLPVRVENPVLV